MSEEKKKFHINWFDVVIIAVVLAVAGAAVLIRNKMTGESSEVKKYTMSFVAETQNVKPDTADTVKVGDSIYNSIENTYIGKIVEKHTEPHKLYEFSYELGQYIISEDPVYLDLYITIEGEGTVDVKSINIGAYSPAIGKQAYLKSKGYALAGFVVGIDTKDAPIPEDTNEGAGELSIKYQIAVEDIRDISAKAYKVGDRLYDRSSGALLGVIEKIEIKPHYETKVWNDGAYSFERVGKYDAILTLRAHATEKDYGYYLDAGVELKVGTGSNLESQSGVFINARNVCCSLKFVKILEVK